MPYGTPVTSTNEQTRYQIEAHTTESSILVQLFPSSGDINDWNATFQSLLDALDGAGFLTIDVSQRIQDTHTQVTPTP